MTLKQQLSEDMKSALRAKDRERLSVIRMTMSAIRQREIDEQRELDDADVLEVIEKMVKQRRDAEAQYRDAVRAELADAEAAEMVVLESYLPAQLSEAELDAMVDGAIEETGATTMRDMGTVMTVLKPRIQGRADMAAVSATVKHKLQA